MKDGQPKAIQLNDYKVPPYLIEQTDLAVDLFEDRAEVSSTLRLRRNPEFEGDPSELVLDGQNMELTAVAIDDRALMSNEYTVDEETLTLHDVPEAFTLTSSVVIRPQENTALEGLYKSGDMFCTQCEAEGFRNITYYLDRPDVMSRFSTTISADKSTYPVLLSNGNAIARSEEADGRHRITWQDPHLKPAYLFALVAGDLKHIEDSFTTMSGRDVTLQIFTEAHNIDKVDFAMASLKHAMAWDEQIYGREYDLDIFMIVAVESFNMGAMENKGLNVFNTSCVLARPDTTTDAGYQRVEGVVAHEYFHNWSGNRVTCRDWFQLSLKEGFTVFRDQQFSADMGSADVCRVGDASFLRTVQYPEDAGPMAHPVRPDSYIEINNFYTTTVYEKGAEIVRMIHTLLGPARFRAGSDLYFERHDGQAVTTEDFVVALEDASGVDLTQFRNWYRQAGTPVLNVDGQFDAEARTFSLRVAQSCPATPTQPEKEPFYLPLAVGLIGPDGNDLPLRLEGPDAEPCETLVLPVGRTTETFVFTDVDVQPVPSLLRGFSAPVRLEYAYSRDDLTFLMSNDSDGFCRWEAGQRLAVDVINEQMKAAADGEVLAVDSRLLAAFESNLMAVVGDTDGAHDKAMVAAMLTLPAEAFLADQQDVADIDLIHAARTRVRDAIADAMRGVMLSVYKLNFSEEDYAPSAPQIAARSLRNTCLAYLASGASEADSIPLAVKQFESADNMTDEAAALRALVNAGSDSAVAARDKALAAFYSRWADEALVIDQWFMIQAASVRPGTLGTVRQLREHEAFTLLNPNRFRALVSGFAQNLSAFHDASGGGYEFLADRIIELDPINPQVAARVCAPLTRWRRIAGSRQTLMKAQLNRILESEGLSRDVYEIVSKSA